MTNLKGKKVGVLGLGVENLPLVKFLIKEGAIVTVCDANEHLKRDRKLKVKEWRLGSDYLCGLNDFDIIFRSPGIFRLKTEIIKAELRGLEVSSSIKLFFELCKGKIIGVTGTKGKGTCAALIYEILKKRYKSTKTKIYLAGNIGTPAISLVNKIKSDDWVVLELSSFQLQDLNKSPHIAVVLGVTSDHLDYHKNVGEYVEAKQNIVLHQFKKDFAVINLDYLTSFEFAALSKAQTYWFSRRKSVERGCFVKWHEIKEKGNKRFGLFGEVILRTNIEDQIICPTYDIRLIGEHNLENVCAAVIGSYLAGAKVEDIKKMVTRFSGLEHRLELVGEIDGVKYINDSYSTTPETTMAAISAFSAPVVLICGGRSKGGDYDKLVREIEKSTLKSIISIGEMANVFEDKLKNKIKVKNLELSKMEDIIQAASREAKKGDIVLFSPGCTSFDMFKNATERGVQFKRAVKKIK
ncbi:MAG: UDP-N-acetylmuramoyl-L-alanine--D-glutamate ligase [Candidatus Berkelbacteria bacterium]|nr:UDP-N-acetylmuramoyl-L-alanine--D-glutamate ligase [Candidatus Berkelbacteria bacterium]